MDKAVYDAMMGVEDWVDYPPHGLTRSMPEKIETALKEAGYVIVRAAEIERLQAQAREP